MSLDHENMPILDETHKKLALELCQLPCFNSLTIDNIAVIDVGLSQSCFQVDDTNQRYFAKYLTGSYVETTASQIAAFYGIAPKVVYAGNNWLVTEFKVAQELNTADLSENEKITLMLTMLAQCHQIDEHSDSQHHNEQLDSVFYKASHLTFNSAVSSAGATSLKPIRKQKDKLSALPKLNVTAVIDDLLQQLELSDQQNQQLKQLSKKLMQNLNKANEQAGNIRQVFCHGDANFSNVLLVKNNLSSPNTHDYLLVDFECACIAPIEYDLAMMMAVNGIEANKIEIIYQLYLQGLTALNKQGNAHEIVDNSSVELMNVKSLSSKLVTCYYDLSILITGLWYFVAYQSRQQLKYKNLALKQLQLLAKSYPELYQF